MIDSSRDVIRDLVSYGADFNKKPDGSTDPVTDDEKDPTNDKNPTNDKDPNTQNPGGNTETPENPGGTDNPSVTPEYVEKEETVYVCVNSVKVRTTPDRSIETNVKTYLSYCTAVKRVADNGIWSKVEINEEILYVSSDCLTTDDLTAPGFTEVNQVVVATDNVHIRKGPSTSTESLGILQRGECIERIGVNENWSRVVFEGKICYIYADYLMEFEVENPIVPENPETPENPDNPENPENPDNPDNPDNPENPENPDNPDNPDNPENPGDPDEDQKPSNNSNIEFRKISATVVEISSDSVLLVADNGTYYKAFSLLISFHDLSVGQNVEVSYLVRSKPYSEGGNTLYLLYAVGFSPI